MIPPPPMTDTSLMPFGKYKGRPLSVVPASYLDWISGEEWSNNWPRVLQYIATNRKWIDQEIEDDREDYYERWYC